MQLTHSGRVPNRTWPLSSAQPSRCVMCSDLAKDTAASTISSTSREKNPRIVVWCFYFFILLYFIVGREKWGRFFVRGNRSDAGPPPPPPWLSSSSSSFSFSLTLRLSRTQRSGTNKRVPARLRVVFCFRRRECKSAANSISHFCFSLFLSVFFSFADTNCCSALAQGRRHLAARPECTTGTRDDVSTPGVITWRL